MKNEKAKEKLEVILKNNIVMQLDVLKELKHKLPPLEEPITFNLERFNEILPTDNYFKEGPRKDSND